MVFRKLHTIASCVKISSEVSQALKDNAAVVALESAIITHGMPRPHNYNTALQVEEIVRHHGAIPATVGVVDGFIKVGLTRSEIASLSEETNTVKTSRRDLPYVISKRLCGGTTVSATIIAARHAGIKLFVTGGIGGVHRDGQDTLDISADLIELGRNSIAVVCSGVKSILDIERTLEYLETQGVCVATFGPTRDFPAFYTRQSGHIAPYNVSSIAEAAALVQSQQQLKLKSGILLAVPVPEEHEHVKHEIMERNIIEALESAKTEGIKGKAVTPFVLSKLAHLTEGHSLKTNVALIKNNAKIGAQIAVALDKTIKAENKHGGPVTHFVKPSVDHPIVIGGSIVDCVVNVTDKFKVEGYTLQGKINQCGGGVGRNLADALGKLNCQPKLISAVGDDKFGEFLLNETLNHVNCEGVMVHRDKATARYTAIMDNEGEFRVGVGDMDIHSSIVPSHVSRFLTNCPMVIIDGNIPFESMQLVLEFCQTRNIPVMFEPTDVNKAAVPFHSDLWKSINIITPNLKELCAIASFLGGKTISSETFKDLNTDTLLQEILTMAAPVALHINTVLVTLGNLGIVIIEYEENGHCCTARYYPASVLDNVVSASGAGDCFAAGFIAGKLTALSEAESVSIGFAAGSDSLLGIPAVPAKFETTPKHVMCSIIRENSRTFAV